MNPENKTPQLNAALAKAKAELPTIMANKSVNIPTKSGRNISFTYAELEEIIPAITPTLSVNGLAIAHQLQFVGEKYCLVSSLRHESGEQLESYFPLPSNFEDPKDLGNKITYGRRYSTLCLLDIVAADDSDPDEKRRGFVQKVRQEAGLSIKPSDGGGGSLLHSMSGISDKPKVRESIEVLPASSSSLLPKMPGTNSKINEAQGKRLWAIALTELDLDNTTIKAAQKHFGFENTYDITIDKYEPIIECLRLLPSEPWHIWKSPEDALQWAEYLLPEHSKEFLNQEFAQLEATNGKKAPAWARRVLELKKEF